MNSEKSPELQKLEKICFSIKKNESGDFILGTGFFINETGLALTAWHVVKHFGNGPFFIRYKQRSNHPKKEKVVIAKASIEDKVENKDIALLQIDVSNIRLNKKHLIPLSLGHRQNSKVLVAGFQGTTDSPGLCALNLKTRSNKSVESRFFEFIGNATDVIVLIPENANDVVHTGSSGAPVFDLQTNYIIGVNIGTKDDIAANLPPSYAYRTDDIPSHWPVLRRPFDRKYYSTRITETGLLYIFPLIICAVLVGHGESSDSHTSLIVALVVSLASVIILLLNTSKLIFSNISLKRSVNLLLMTGFLIFIAMFSWIFLRSASDLFFPSIKYSPTELDFEINGGQTSDIQTFKILNSGQGSLSYNLSTDQQWISISPISGIVSGDGALVNVFIKNASFSTDVNNGKININSSGGSGEIKVSVKVNSPILSYAPQTLSIQEQEKSQFGNQYIKVWNSGNGTLIYNLSSNQSWITLNTLSGNITTGNNTISVSINATAIQPGQNIGVISITSNGGSGNVSVSVNTTSPVLSFTPTQLDFGTSYSDIKTFNIWNRGGDVLSYNLTANQSWITLTPSGGNVITGNDTITVSINPNGLHSEQNTGKINITSNGGSGDITVSVTGKSPILSYSHAELDFGARYSDIKAFNIWNRGGDVLSYNLTANQSWITLTPSGGNVTTGNDTITVSINPNGLYSGQNTGKINITSNGGSVDVTVSVNVTFPIIPYPPENDTVSANVTSPILAFSPVELDFGKRYSDIKTFNIWNRGGDVLNYNLTADQSWITLNPSSGNVTNNDTVTITVSINTSTLTPESYKGHVNIASNGGSGNVTISVNVNGISGGGGGESTPVSILAFSPVSLDFGAQLKGYTGNQTFSLWNGGNGTVSYNLTADQSWITLNPSSGNVTNGNDTVTVSINTSSLPLGQNTGTINLASNGGSGNVTVLVNVLNPSLAFSPVSMDFGAQLKGYTGNQTFSLWNGGNGTLSYNLTADQSWIILNSSGGNVTTGNDTVTVSINTSSLPLGQNTGTINLASNGGSGNVTVVVNVLSPLLSYFPTSLDFGSRLRGYSGNQTFSIWNAGNGTLTYNLTADQSWIILNSPGGNVTTGNDTVTVSINTSSLPLGQNTGTINLASNGGSGNVTVAVNVLSPLLSYFPTSLDFGSRLRGYSGNQTFSIWNAGNGTLTYNLTADQSWIILNSSGGNVTTGNDTVTVSINTSSLPLGQNTGTINLASNGGSGNVTVAVNVLSPLLSYFPASLDFGSHLRGYSGNQTFSIWNAGNGTLSYNLTADQSWITLDILGGNITTGNDTVTVSINTSALPLGQNTGTINLASNGGSGNVTVAVNVLSPLLSYFPASLDFGSRLRGYSGNQTFSIWNAGNGTLNYNLTADQSWITLDTLSGIVTTGNNTITVSIDTTALPAGPNSSIVNISSDGGTGSVNVLVDVVPQPNPLTITTTALPRWTVEVFPTGFPASWLPLPPPGWIIGQPYIATLAATGGTGSLSWNSTNLPPGLSVSAQGVVSGTPTLAGTYAIVFSVGDNANPPASQSSTLTLKIYLIGDASGNDRVSVQDVTYVENVILGLKPPTAGCDANISLTITVSDQTKIERIILGLP